MNQNSLAVGVDVGGSSIKSAVVDLSSGDFTVARRSVPTPAHGPVAAMLESIATVVSEFDPGLRVGIAFPSVIRAGIVYNRTALTATSRITIRNNTANTMTGPLSLVITGLPDGVTLTNPNAATGAGAIYNLTVPLAPGQSVIVNLNFSLNAIKAINYTATVFSGTL